MFVSVLCNADGTTFKMDKIWLKIWTVSMHFIKGWLLGLDGSITMSILQKPKFSSKEFLPPIISKFNFQDRDYSVMLRNYILKCNCVYIIRGKEWNSQKKNCLGELQPLAGSSYPGGEPPAVSVVNRVLSTIKKPVYLLDITTLSQLRKDAHPSTYSNADSGTDCSHWCLPGLPDTWNQLLYAALVMWRLINTTTTM